MATNTPRPGRTLAAFFLVTAVLFGAVAFAGDWSPRLGLDLQGGTRITLQATTSTGEGVTSEKIAEARGIIEQRVNGTGVSEAEVTTQGADQIIVEVPGQQQQGLVEEVGRTAQLRFRLVWGIAQPQQPQQPPGSAPTQAPTAQPSGSAPTAKPSGSAPTAKPTAKPTTKPTAKPSKRRVAPAWASAVLPGDDSKKPKPKPTDPTATVKPSPKPTPSPTETTPTPTGPVAPVDWSKLSLQQSLAIEKSGRAPEGYTDALAALNATASKFECNQAGLGEVVDDPAKPLITCDPQSGTTYILSPSVIEGTQLDDASAGVPQQSFEWIVQLNLNGEAADTFTEVTKQLSPTGSGVSQGLPFAIVLDGEVISAPNIQAVIPDGNPTISGGSPAFTQETATSLANSLKYGSLPLTFVVNGVSVEGPSLAGSQLDAGLLAGVFGMALVIAYCLFYYRGLGLVIIASLLMSGLQTYAMVLLLGASIGFALSLPGIAGLIVAIGVTADSFIVYFERLRDEVREGKSLRLAVEAGWKRARATILAADTVSLLSAVVLFTFAIGVVRGFAFTLGLTTAIDIFLVFFFTKPLVTLLARTKFFGQGHKLSGLDAKHLGVSGRRVTQMARTSRGEA